MLKNFEWNSKKDLLTEIDFFLTEERLSYKKENFYWVDWSVASQDTFNELVDKHLLYDFKHYIIPKLEDINTKESYENALKKENENYREINLKRGTIILH